MPDSQPLSSPRAVTSRLKRYEILAPLGAGGTAELLLARATGIAGFTKLFAIKRIRENLAQDRALVSQILNEARLASTLQHSNIVQMFDAEADGETVFLVMEYLHGRDVAAMLHRARTEASAGIPIEHALSIAVGVCAGLHFAHEQVDADGRPLTIVHRDVSPQNVIVTYDGVVKVIDFGIAKATSSVEQTLFGQVKGKLGYMSPEQCRGEPLDRRSDIFGIGILLYEMTTGRLPFEAPDAERFFDAVLDTDPLPPSRFGAYPPELERIILKALARERRARYPTAREVHRDLEAFAQREGIRVSQLALAEFMASLFAEDSAAFRQARGDAASLAEYVIARQTGANPARTGSMRASIGDEVDTLPHERRAPSIPQSTLVVAETPAKQADLAPVAAVTRAPRARSLRLGTALLGVVAVTAFAWRWSTRREPPPVSAALEARPTAAARSSAEAAPPAKEIAAPAITAEVVASAPRAPEKVETPKAPAKILFPPPKRPARPLDLDSPLPR